MVNVAPLQVHEHRFAPRNPIVDVIDAPLDQDPGPPRHLPKLRQHPNFFKPAADADVGIKNDLDRGLTMWETESSYLVVCERKGRQE